MYYYDGNVLQTIADSQFVCRRDINEGVSHYCTLQKKGENPIDLFDYVSYFESPSFSLTVTENSPMREKVEMPIAPGTYDTFIAAYGIMLNASDYPKIKLPDGEYRLKYGNVGRGGYKSDSVQDFIVRSAPTEFTTMMLGNIQADGNQKGPLDKKLEKKISEVLERL
jgi:hypothetical protein